MAKISGKDVTVVCMYDYSNPKQKTGNSPQSASFCSVGVQDVRLLLPNQKKKFEEGSEILSNSHRAKESFQPANNSLGLQQVRHIRFLLIDFSSYQYREEPLTEVMV